MRDSFLIFCEGFFTHIFVKNSFLMFDKVLIFFPIKEDHDIFDGIHFDSLFENLTFSEKFQIFRELYCFTFDVFLRKLLSRFCCIYSSVQQCSVCLLNGLSN